jgi:hypothetical protein
MKSASHSSEPGCTEPERIRPAVRAEEAKQLRKGDQVLYQAPDPPFRWYRATVDSVEVLPDRQVVVGVYVPALQSRRYRSCGRLSWWIGWLSRKGRRQPRRRRD